VVASLILIGESLEALARSDRQALNLPQQNELDTHDERCG
jgi:hypothetical protein